jgi:hypothetical protein
MAVNFIQMPLCLRKNNNEKSSAYGKYYVEVDNAETLTTEGLVQHIRNHNCAVGEEAIAAVLWHITFYGFNPDEEEETFNRMGEEESSEDGCCLVVVLILMNDWIATFIPLFIYRQVIAYLNTKRWCNIWWSYQE